MLIIKKKKKVRSFVLPQINFLYIGNSRLPEKSQTIIANKCFTTCSFVITNGLLIQSSHDCPVVIDHGVFTGTRTPQQQQQPCTRSTPEKTLAWLCLLAHFKQNIFLPSIFLPTEFGEVVSWEEVLRQTTQCVNVAAPRSRIILSYYLWVSGASSA